MKVTVKTMDVGSHEFELVDEATVEALKKQIAEKMEIPLDKQRLIFHGKVLKDDKPLKEYGVDGMVVHLVKSAPPPPGPGEGGGPVNQPRRRIVTSSVRQDDDHTITLEATQDMLFMSPEGLPSEGDIAQMTQNIVSQIVGALSSHGAHGTVSAEATATDTEGKTHVMSATASTKKPEEIETKESFEDGSPVEVVEKTAKPAPTKAEEPVKTEAIKPEDTMADTERATPTAPPPSEPGPSGVAAATGQEEEVKSKPAEKKTQEPQRTSLFDFDDDDNPEELERLEQERIQRSMKNLYSQARTVKRCLQYATKVLDRYDKSQERVAKKKAEDDAKRAAGIPLDQEVMLDLREALIADRRKAEEAKKKKEEKMEVNEDDPFAILQSGTLDFIPSQLYLKFKDELDQTEARAQPIIDEFRRLVEENQNLDDDQLVQAQRVAITVKDFNYYIGHAYVALGRLDVQLDRPAPRHLRLYAPRRTEMRRIFQQLRSMPPQPPSGYIIDIQREGEGGGAGGGAGGAAQGRNTRAMISRGPAGLFGSLAGLAGADRNQTLSEALGRQSRSGGLEELVNRTTGPDFKATLAEVKKEQDERHKKEAEEAEKMAEAGENSEKIGETSLSADTSTSTKPAAEKELPKLETKELEAMDTSEQPEQEKATEEGKVMEHEAPMEEDKPMEQDKPVEQDKPASSETGGASVSAPGPGGSGGGAQGAAGGEGEKKEPGEKKEGGEGDGEDDSETPQYLARLLSELITGMVAPGMEAAPNDAIHEVEKKGGGASTKSGGGASADTSGDRAEETSAGGASDEPKPSEGEPPAEKKSESSSSEEPKKMSFAERYAGPEGTTVTIKAAPQMPSFPGLPPMEGPSVSIRNPGGGKPPEAVVNFPMPPAFQLLRQMLRHAQMREKQEQEAAAKGESGEKGAEGATPGGETAEKKPKKPRLVLPPKQKEKPFVQEDGELSSVSDAGSIDSIDSDDEGPKDEEILFGDQSLKGIGEHRSMHDAMAELRDHFGDTDDDEEEEMGMVEMLLKAISHQITVIEVMGVFQGNTDPLKKLQQPLLNFISDRTLYGAPPTTERKDIAVKNFLINCQSSIKAVEHRIPLRNRGIDFPKTMYNCLFEIFQEGFENIISRYRTRTPTIFARSIKYWATRSSARFGAVVRHCLDGDGPEFEETVKLLMSTLFPPTTPPMILTMCSSSILKEIRRLKDNYRFTPTQLEKYVVWKEGATPTANRSYMVTQYMQNYVMYHDNTPLPVLQKESLPTEEAEPKQEGVGVEGGASPSHSAGPQQPFSDAYLMEMPAKKRKLDTSEIQTMESPELLEKLIKKAFDMTGAKPLKEEKTKEQHMDELKNDQTLVSSLVEEFYYSIRERLEKDPDYDPEKYPNAHKFFNVRKWPGQMKEEDKQRDEKAADMKEGKSTKQEEGAAASSSEAKTDPEGACASSAAPMDEDN